MFSLRSPTRPVGVTLICLMVLTQASCATFQMSPSLTPPPGEGGTEDPGEDVSYLPDLGNGATIVAVAIVGGYLLYKVITRDRGEADGRSEFGSSLSLPGCRPLVSPDPAGSFSMSAMTHLVPPGMPSYLYGCRTSASSQSRDTPLP